MTTILDTHANNPLNVFSIPLEAFLTSSSSPARKQIAVHIVDLVTTSSDPAHALWKLWDAFFTAVVNADSYQTLLALLDTLRAQPPTQPNKVRVGSNALGSYISAEGKLHWETLPRFSAQWHDVHDILEARRDWDGVRDAAPGDHTTATKLSSRVAEYYLRFCSFSAALLKATNGSEEKGGVHPIWVFYACRDVLEYARPRPQAHDYQPKAYTIPWEEVWALDVRVAATWVRDGGRALWEVGHEELRRHWAASLDSQTELWLRDDGLTVERWYFWEGKLRHLSIEAGILDLETRGVVGEAAEVVSDLLRTGAITQPLSLKR
ncbi:hypothetical protein NUU61_002120 [Penicillium alfredii]|uniref:Uncharacterized protein n=1 Tax=Penicillium alfredii TaxID=1506179 RepID=A0A9W9KGJ2_9EURO|nr:uncharacterized protein NUU61_002120 [Penicillium alfredii]KAJ5104773.1 hypothetical protein NUU61_002120 [Penicillium alfredii]